MPKRTPKVRPKPQAIDDGVEFFTCIVDQTRFLSHTYPEPPCPEVVPPDVVKRAKDGMTGLKPGQRYALVFRWCGPDDDGKDVWFSNDEWSRIMLLESHSELRQKYIVDKPDMFPDLETASNDTTTPIETPVRTPQSHEIDDTAEEPTKPEYFKGRVYEPPPSESLIISGVRARKDMAPWDRRLQ